MTRPVHVIGGGLAGSEAAWQLARAGIPVVLHEMRPVRGTPAHKTDQLAELVCSNSFRSDDAETNAVGVLHAELRMAGSLILAAADAHQVPAGAALAVDREGFARTVQQRLLSLPNVTLVREELTALPAADIGPTIVATGPLTSPALSDSILKLTGESHLSFFDAIAPVVHRDSINFDIAWFQSRWDKEGPGGEKDAYINCPLEREAYFAFVAALVAGEKTEFKDWEKDTPYFEGCLPIEVMAERGPRTLAFGPMKPVGLRDPRTGRRPYAVVQLRQDNALGTLFNMVGFQTKLKHGEQVRIFRTIPGLENAEFARLGGIHRNTFLNSPRLLDGELRLKAAPWLRFAGQITGVEGYVESTAMGLLAGLFAAAEVRGIALAPPPPTTSMGALLAHITGGHLADGTAFERQAGHAGTFQPMNANFGLLPPLPVDEGQRPPRGVDRKKANAARAHADFRAWIAGVPTAQRAAE
jgi:methylenetetrahydrofolate--tRNA-(uracil-5-)-methyltransferase